MGLMGKEVASQILTVKDDGTVPGGLGSSNFDREGLPHKPLTLIDKGVLSNFMYNTYTAKKESVSSTSHADGNTRSPPTIEPTNLMIEPGKESWLDMVGDVKKGVLVNRFSGFPQMISGDFSGIVKGGWLIEDGELVKPVIETMIAGNIFDLLKNVSQVSKERKKLLNFIMPYVRIDDVSITGG
jgi:PmbA protein